MRERGAVCECNRVIRGGRRLVRRSWQVKERQGANAQSKTTNEKKMVCGKRGEERRGEGGGTSEFKSRRSERRQASRCEIQLNDKQTKRLAWLGLAWLGLALFVLLMQGGRQPSSLCFLSVVVVVWLGLPLVVFFFFFLFGGEGERAT